MVLSLNSLKKPFYLMTYPLPERDVYLVSATQI